MVAIPAIVQFWLFVASVAIQQVQAAKMRARQKRAQAEAAAAADKAKGQQLVIESEVMPINVVYGRNLIGGNRVYHKTFHEYLFSDIAAGGQVFEAGTSLSANDSHGAAGPRHEFLITQQSVGFYNISKCWDIDIDGKKLNGEYLDSFDDIMYGDTTGYTEKTDPYNYGCRIHFYGSSLGGVVDPLARINDITREGAAFTFNSYATCVYKLDRDEPQFNGVPTAQFFLEGAIVPELIGGSEKSYSNNPVRCLYDYLTNSVYGKGLNPDISIDIASFEKAAAVCDYLVLEDVPKAGAIWRNKPEQRDLKLYECNLALSSGEPIRDNIELILDTMVYAELIWSGGVYKMSLKYPLIYEGIPYQIGQLVQYKNSLFISEIADNTTEPVVGANWSDGIDGYLNDYNIVRENNTTISWPNAGTRLNFVTIRFLDESKDFKENTVSWPPKTGIQYAIYLEEDNGIVLEHDQFVTGITDHYHALARAEQLVRTSRIAVTYEFSVDRNFIYIEPGDILKVNSEILGITDAMIRVNEVNPDAQNGTIKIAATKFDANSIKWNVTNDEVLSLTSRPYPYTAFETITTHMLPDTGGIYSMGLDTVNTGFTLVDGELTTIRRDLFNLKNEVINTGFTIYGSDLYSARKEYVSLDVDAINTTFTMSSGILDNIRIANFTEDESALKTSFTINSGTLV